ncbi:MAG TPA: VOC family protein [Acidimicrobiales bacterium]
MATRLTDVVIDANDPAALARFWSAALDWPVTFEHPRQVTVSPPADDPRQHGQVPLDFVLVTDPKVGKNRLHLDLPTTDQAATVARLEALGARRVDIGQGPEVTWVVMADPEGNELCVVRQSGSVGSDPASAFGDLAPVAAIVLDTPDPDGVAPFWSATTGWPILGRDEHHVWLRDPAARGPYLDLRRNDDPKVVKVRVHLDVSPYPDGSQQEELDRLLATGATPVDIGQVDVPWHVLADPTGTELCLLTPR